LIDRFWCSTLSPNTSRSDGDEILRLAGAAVASSARLAERSLGVLVGRGTADGSSFIQYCPKKTTGSETWYCGYYYLICHSHTIRERGGTPGAFDLAFLSGQLFLYSSVV
jgi:hypothetical protein